MKKSAFAKYSALALMVGMCLHTAYAKEFSQVIIFGDSLSDTGRLKDMVARKDGTLGNTLQPSFTTNPDPVWSSLFAQSYGKTASANTPYNPTGTNYAVGGARSGSEVNWNGFVNVPSTKTQITDHLTATGGKADPNTLYAIWIGSNDLISASQATTTAEAQNAIKGAVTRTVIDIETLNQAGATTILVPNVPDLSLTPRAIYGESLMAGVQDKAKLASSLYNSGLFEALNQSTANIIPANTFALLQEATTNKEAFGFKNTQGVACQMPARTTGADDVASTSLACTKANLIENGANDTYAFADDIHPSGRTHRILAQYYRSIMDAPTHMGKLSGELVKTGSAHDRHVYRQLDRLSGSQHSIWANVHASDRTDPTTQIGLDVAGSSSHTGAYLSHQNQDYVLDDTLSSDVKTIGMGLYHRHDIGNVRLKGVAGIDRLSVDTHRHIDWEGASRSHTADTTARRFHAGLQASYGIDMGKATVRPLIGVHAQKVKVRDLVENEPTLSTAMRFGEQEQKSLQGEIGVDVAYPISPALTLTGGIAHAHEFNDDERTINATLTSIREYTKGFNTSVSTDKSHATTAHLGVQGQLGKANIHAGVHATHQDSDTDVGGSLGVRLMF
uniref:Lipase/phospholipase B n=1 Tax=Moraxella bovis TaxID=476 RepID=Q939K7_MORBO|nr:lipase/phospholipase B [Moraxella bovis]